MVLAFAITGGVLVTAGVLMMWLARRSQRGLLKRNRIAGVCTPLTMSSDAAWYLAQRAAAPRTKVAGWGGVIGGAGITALGIWGLRSDIPLFIYMILVYASVAWLVGWVLAGAASAQRAARNAVGNDPKFEAAS